MSTAEVHQQITADEIAHTFEEGEPVTADLSANDHGIGRDLFARLRRGMGGAETGASLLGDLAA